MMAMASITPVASAATHKDKYSMSCDVLWAAVKDTVRNSGKYGIIGIDNTEMSISYNIGGGLGGKRINSVVLNRLGPNECEMQTQTAFSGLAHNDYGDFKKRVQDSLTKLAGDKPKGVETAALKEREQSDEAPAVSTRASADKGTVALTANIDAAELSVDGAFVGTTPAKLTLAPGKHKIRVSLDGYDPWEKEIEVLAASEVNLKATLYARAQK
jgi:hypothetical protein